MGRSSPTVAIQSSFCGLIIISLNSLVATSMSSLNYMLSLKLGHNLKLPAGKVPIMSRHNISCRDILSLFRELVNIRLKI